MKINPGIQEKIRLLRRATGSLIIAALCSLAAFPQGTAPSLANDSTTDFITTNGLKTIHRHIPGNDVVAVQIYFRGCSRNINEKNTGIETTIIAVIQQGTKSCHKSQINRE